MVVQKKHAVYLVRLCFIKKAPVVFETALTSVKNLSQYCCFRGGMLCRLWAAIKARRKTQLSTHNEDSEDTLL